MVKHPTLDLSSGLDLRVRSSSPALGVDPTLKRERERKQKKKRHKVEWSLPGAEGKGKWRAVV